MEKKFAFPVLEVGGLLLIVIAMVLLVGQIGSFAVQRQGLPGNLTVADVPVGGLAQQEAQARIEQAYAGPVTVRYRNEVLELDPRVVNYTVNSNAMLAEADELRTEGGTYWVGFWDYIWGRPEQAYSVDLQADYSEEALRDWLLDVAARYDSPPVEPEPVLETLSFEGGSPGYEMNVNASLPLLREALNNPTGRTVDLVVEETSAAEANMDTLGELVVDYLEARDYEYVASLYVVDLASGEELELNLDFREGTTEYLDCEIAFAGMSTMKIGIMMEFFRALDYVPQLGSNDYEILYATMTQSGNTTANFMLQRAGFDNIQRGVSNLNTMLDALGVENTFMASYYEDLADPEYYSTPAREAARAGECVNTLPDPYMQTTTRDLTLLLDMIYQCAEFNGGPLRTVYPEQITQEDCQEMLIAMAGNEKGSLIMAGVPETVEVAHKHGWTYDTHGDAGIVFSPGGDYAIAIMLWAPLDWYPVQQSFPLIESISEIVFNFYNPDLIDTPRRGLYPDEIGLAPSN